MPPADGSHPPTRETFAAWLIAWGGSIHAFWFGAVTCCAAGILLGVPVHPWYLAFALAPAIGVAWMVLRETDPRGALWRAGLVVLAALAVAAAAVALAGAVYDVSWDGQSYQQEAVAQLAHRWVPFPRPEPLFLTEYGLQLIHYPKGAWFGEALVYTLTGRLETGKALHLILALASLCLVGGFLLRLPRIRALPALGLALVLCANPVILCQTWTFYVDGILASTLTAYLAVLGLYWLQPGKTPGRLAAMLAALLAGVKFTGLAFAVIPAAALVLLLLANRPRRPAGHLAVWAAAGLAWGVLAAGFNPYVTNWVRSGHPLFPMAGEEAVYYTLFAPKDRPANFREANRLERLALSLLARSEDVAAPGRAALKWPLTVHAAEIEEFRRGGAATRVGGWGPWFGAAMLLALPLAGLLARRDWRRLWPAGVLLLAVGASVLVVSECWWARYAPQLWLVPGIVGGAAAFGSDALWLRRIGRVLLLILAINAALAGILTLAGNLEASAGARQQLARLAAAKQPVVVYFSWFRANRYRLQEAGIRYREVPSVKQLPCPQPEVLAGSETRFCSGH